MAIGNWIEQAVNFAVFVTLARLLGTKEYGLLAMASVFIVLCESLVRESLSEYLIAAQEPKPEDLNATFWLLAGLGGFLAVLLAMISGVAARAYGEPQVRWLILALAPSVLIVALNAVPVAILRRELSFRILSLRAIAGVVLGGVVGIGMAVQGYGVWSFVGQWLTLIATNAVMAWTAVSWRPGLSVGRPHFIRAAQFGLQVLGLRAGELAATQTPLLIIGATLGAEATGLYSVAWRLIETLSFLIVTPLRQASQSAFAALLRDGGDAGGLLLDIARLTGAVALPFFAGLAVLALPIIGFVFGPAWAGAAPVLAVMAPLGVYICLARVQIAFCLGAGQAGVVAALAWGAVTLMAGAIWIASGMGIVAVGGAVVAAHYLLWPLYYLEVAKVAKTSAAGFLSCHVVPFIGTVIMAWAVLVALTWVSGLSGMMQLALCVPLGIAVYGAFAALMMRDRFVLLRDYARGAR